MSDLISRQDAIDALAEMYCKSDEDGYVWIIRGDACLRIDALPSVDAVEVVRCGECKHYNDGWCYNPNTYDDEKTRGNTSPDWYCADGEQKGEE